MAGAAGAPGVAGAAGVAGAVGAAGAAGAAGAIGAGSLLFFFLASGDRCQGQAVRQVVSNTFSYSYSSFLDVNKPVIGYLAV